ncbi:hypothetical protein NUW58_g1080 [Xylaria curta]|uniref:Uncharacterized protein n=1 Tax=Xylaria curta TaxID=42375 RepID=A0ACC1PLW0_9PEZI|nr:hypothetical protein NUW58_g1080 [Xylaria curta]
MAATPSSSNWGPMQSTTMEYIINHVILPPKLPQVNDYSPANDGFLLHHVIESFKLFRDVLQTNEAAVTETGELQRALAMLNNLASICTDSIVINKQVLQDSIAQLHKHYAPIPLYVRAQNAGIIISSAVDSSNDNIHFELFELSPRNEAVMSTVGRLQRTFPGCAIAVPREEAQKPTFLSTITDALAKMSDQLAHGAVPKVKKAGNELPENRDTTHPKMVTELLGSYLRSVGKMVEVSSISKNTRQDVLWQDADLPWHRSALWLLIRVTLQLFFSRQGDESVTEDIYKNYMLFFMARILQQARQQQGSTRSDVIWTIKAKLTRRRLKLEGHGYPGVLQFVDNILCTTGTDLENRWSEIQRHDPTSHKFDDINHLPAAQDTLIYLEKLDKYLEAIKERESCRQAAEVHTSCPLPDFTSPLRESFDKFPSETPLEFKLLKFESWVETQLDEWEMTISNNHEACRDLRMVIESYHQCAVTQYPHNPEATSTMLLTIMRLWVTLDKLAIGHCHLLAEYHPGFPVEIFHKLILPEKGQMKRLRSIEQYLTHRASAKFPEEYIFHHYGWADCFSVRYFNQSEKHQNALADIKQRAEMSRNKKLVELEELRSKYKYHLEEHIRLDCSYYTVTNWKTGYSEKRHSSRCKRCDHREAMESLRIKLHEWPLPEDENEARTVVFELLVPPIFGHWRDSTVFTLTDVLGLDYKPRVSCGNGYTLTDIKGLHNVFEQYGPGQRISLFSTSKPHLRTHRNLQLIATTSDDEVCVRNGAAFRYIDCTRETDAESLVPTHYLTEACTFRLSANSTQLQPFLDDTVQPVSFSNTIIANQSQCPQGLSLEEYKAMASLRAGSKIRWHNVLKELASPSVDMGKEDTVLIILQCIQQAGKILTGDILRETHSILNDRRFSTTLLDNLMDSCNKVSQNWQSAPALSAFISIANRVLSLSSALYIQESSLEVLFKARGISIRWAEELKRKAQNATVDRVRDQFISRSAFVALICADSFNMDSNHMHRILSEPDQATIFIRTAIIIQESRQTIATKPGSLTALLHHRWKRLCLRSFPILVKLVEAERNPALDKAIVASWATYRPVGQWHALDYPYQHWMKSESASDELGNKSIVQLSMLTGELLVNGVPRNRLPKEYEGTRSYQTLFGKSSIETMPSLVRGMRFSGQFADHELHFNLSTEQHTLPEKSLQVQASTKGVTLELVPPSLFRNKFPIAFVEKFVHWYNIKNDYVEFRPCDHPWFHTDDNWKLYRIGEGNAWQLKKAGKSLVHISSGTATRLYQIFESLENESHTHITFDQKTSTLDIDLPRIQLAFYSTSKDALIKSRQHRGMSVHENQRVGTLVGLQSKLVLRSHKADARDLIIIPNGDIRHSRNGDHVCIRVDEHSSTRTQVYEIDRQLGRVVDNGTLTSKLFLAYLHGLTSFCLPDPLTRLTGTNAALTILRSAAIRSFPSVGQEEIKLLVNIAGLTPRREYYPDYLREMETVHWSPTLGFLAQHTAYHQTVQSLFAHFDRSNLFYHDNPTSFPPLAVINHVLLEREKVRSAFVRAWNFGAEDYARRRDEVYSSRRDRSQDSKEALTALSLSSMVFRGEPNTQELRADEIGAYIWNFLEDNCETLISNLPSSPDNFRYDASFLIESSKRISKEFLIRLKTLKNQPSQLDKSQVMIWLATLSFAKNLDKKILYFLAAFFISPTMKALEIPEIQSFHLPGGLLPPEGDVSNVVRKSAYDFEDTRDAKLKKYRNETEDECRERRARVYNEGVNRTVQSFTKGIMNQWPCGNPQIPQCVELEVYINTNQAMETLGSLFRTCYNNRLLHQYLDRVGQNTPRTSIPLDTQVCMPVPAETVGCRPLGFVSSDEVFKGPAPLHITNIKSETPKFEVKTSGTREVSLLFRLIKRLSKLTCSQYEKEYMTGLKDSFWALGELEYRRELELGQDKVREILHDHRAICEHIVEEVYSAMVDAIKKTLCEKVWSHGSGKDPKMLFQHFPQPSPILFLRHLSRKRWGKLPEDWKKCFIHYGLVITQLQQANRLLDAFENPTALIKEAGNCGHENWDPYDYPESLLVEIENSILIRKVQEDIASEMRNPRGGKNTVMQLNMGEGKSSVIVPIVATSLADTTRLVRVIVAKPQSKQMLQMLISKLGGLLDRPIYHLPFSRAINIGKNHRLRSAIGGLLLECMKSGGVLLTQPENILSFMLMGIESSIAGDSTASQELTKTLGYLDTSSRDIIDESDENFSVKFELLYTMGLQRPIEFSPERWICIQSALEILGKVAPETQSEYRSSIEIHSQSNAGFPRIRILQAEGESHLLERIAEEVCKKGLKDFPIVRQTKELRQAVFSYITEVQPSPAIIEMVEDSNPAGFWAKSREPLLLLRGLLAGGIISFCFRQKRWRVDYGLDPSRKPETKLALPFRAKDSPTARSEFSHPEVVIVLTHLSYYYGGVSFQELKLAFTHLLGSDQADVEFQVWVQGATSLPSTFQQLSGINLDDQSTFEEKIFPQFRFSRGTINYFLSHCVFPKEMKEFPFKLSASGWDIGKIKKFPTTGFSGTNDSRAVLPLSVEQLDLPEQMHTNALVLEYLLRRENSVELMPRANQNISDAKMLLDIVVRMSPPVRVILDVGAQILELENLEVAKEWLSSIPDLEGTEAVVFFNEQDELSVVDRKGHIELLQVSSYVNKLDLCLVFLDQAHTRGTELKLPRDYRAAVTLGANLTKDRLVQACMRMRLLGHGQSVVFCVPQEISSKIQRKTWKDTKRNIPLWAAQGRRHNKHKDLWAKCKESGYILTEELAEQFLEDEAQTLEDRYRPVRNQDATHEPDESADDIARRCQQFNGLILKAAVLQEEQERELAPEIEQERQDERPPLAKPQNHRIHQDIRIFVETGVIVEGTDGCMNAFLSLQGTSAASLFDVSKFLPGLLVSADFAGTIKIKTSADKFDSYQRPVQWILTASRTEYGQIEQAMIISPYEANELLPEIQASVHTALHLYAPRPNLSYKPLDRLDLHTVPEALKDREIPRRFITELNLFSGQLYVSSYDNYIDICRFSGLAWEPTKDGEIIGADGFIYRDRSGRVGGESGLQASPVEFFKVLLTKIRRNCETISRTHMGQILDNQLLSPEDFE